MKRKLGLIMVMCVGVLRAQDCSNPTLICGEILEPITLNFEQNLEFECLNSPYVSVLTFMSNSDLVNTGTATLQITGVACQTDNIDDVVEAVIVKPNPQALCETNAYELVSPCVEMAGDFSLQTNNLLPNTTYLILIGTAHNPSITPCNVSLTLTGQAVSINACCTSNIALGQSVSLTVVGGNQELGYTWYPEYGISSVSGDQVVATPGLTTTYSVSGFFGGCQYTDAVTVSVGNPLGIPTSFTPNGDFINDLWSIDGLLDYELADVRIFDRWGQLVYRSIGYAQAWNGKRAGVDVPEGTYYYAIDLNDPLLVDVEAITGFISLIR
jgi:gliding motility-associated-like protein